jgi:Uri superfamily endonuclease
MKGVYILLIELSGPLRLTVRSQRHFDLPEKYYGYIGSALAGLEARLNRHLRHVKKAFWHIDFLLEKGSIRNILSAETAARKECCLAQVLSCHLPSIPGFGSSDCRCRSHLFFTDNYEHLASLALVAFRDAGLDPCVRQNTLSSVQPGCRKQTGLLFASAGPTVWLPY